MLVKYIPNVLVDQHEALELAFFRGGDGGTVEPGYFSHLG